MTPKAPDRFVLVYTTADGHITTIRLWPKQDADAFCKRHNNNPTARGRWTCHQITDPEEPEEPT